MEAGPGPLAWVAVLNAHPDRRPKVSGVERDSATGIDRVFLILEFIGSAERPPTHTEIAAGLNILKSTLSAILSMLRAKGYVEQVERRYVLGPTLLAFSYRTAARATGDLVLREALRPILEGIRRETGETVSLSVEIGGDQTRPGFILAIDTLESGNSLRFVPGVGEPQRLLDTAAGQVLLAASDRSLRVLAERGRLSDRAPDLAAREAELAVVRERGYALTLRPIGDGIVVVAVAVRDHSHIPVAAISVFGPVHRVLPNGSNIFPVLQRWAAEAPERLPRR